MSSVRFVRRTVWEDLTPEQMAERYEAGASLNDLGILTGIGVYRVRNILVARGVTIRPAFGGRGHSTNRYVRN